MPAVVRRGVVVLVLLLQVQAFGGAFLQAWRPSHAHAPAAAIAVPFQPRAPDTVIAVLRAGTSSTAHAHAGTERHHHAPGTPGVIVQRGADDLPVAEGAGRRDRDPPWPLMPAPAFAGAGRPAQVLDTPVRDGVRIRIGECLLRPPRLVA